MIHFRPFLNTDSPAIVELWNQQPSIHGYFSGLTRELLDLHVLGKPYFDRFGLILAIDDEKDSVVGFVHAGFGPNEALDELDHESGIVAQLRVREGENAAELGKGLLSAAEDYLKSQGAKRAQFGCDFPHTPFYLGLYGGSRIPGVLANDTLVAECLRQAGYQTQESICVLEKDLTGFRTIMDRQQLMLRRKYQIKAVVDPLEGSWWESCTMGMAERDRFSIFNKAKREYVGSCSFWDMEPLASTWGTLSRGLYDLRVNEELRRGGMGTYLVGEALRLLSEQNVGLAQVQLRETDLASLGVFHKLGFEQVTQGQWMVKSWASSPSDSRKTNHTS